MNKKRTRNRHRLEDAINAPMVEIFGGAFALLMILFMLVNLFANTEIYAMVEDASEASTYKVSWENGSEGFVVLSFPDRIQILETGDSIPTKDICRPGGAFIRYAHKLYDSRIQQMIFAIVEQGVHTMAIARNCLLSEFQSLPVSIGWIIANKDLLKAVDLQEIPPEIIRSINNSLQKNP